MKIEVFYCKNARRNQEACAECPPAKIILKLFEAGGFVNWKPDRKVAGDSYETGYDLMVDLTNGGVAKNFTIVSGTLQEGRYVHCWLEHEDWVVDFSNGKQRIYGKKYFYEQAKVDKKGLKSLTASQWRRKVQELASEEETAVRQTVRQAVRQDRPGKAAPEAELRGS